MQGRDARVGGSGAKLDDIIAPRRQRRVDHPQQPRVHGAAGLEMVGRGGQHIAARHVDFVGQGQRHRLARDGLIALAIRPDDARHLAAARARQGHDLVAAFDGARRDGSRIAAKVEIGTVDPLHGHGEGGFRARGHGLHGLQMGQQAGAAIPGRALGMGRDIVAVARGQRNRHHMGEAEARRQFAIGLDDGVEHSLVEAHQIHLVHGEHDVAHAQHRHNEGMAARLREDALARVDQNNGEFGGGGAGGHVARILLMAGRVGHDEGALVRAEIAIGHIDGDALFALRRKPVQQQREIEIGALRAEFLAVAFQSFELVFEHAVGVIEHAPDEGRFTVVHRAAGEEAQQGLRAGREHGVRICRRKRAVHQKYPSCFLASMEPEPSWSIMRP